MENCVSGVVSQGVCGGESYFIGATGLWSEDHCHEDVFVAMVNLTTFD
jgi:hypothetical protein